MQTYEQLEELMNNFQNYKNYRLRLEKEKGSVLPYLGKHCGI